MTAYLALAISLFAAYPHARRIVRLWLSRKPRADIDAELSTLREMLHGSGSASSQGQRAIQAATRSQTPARCALALGGRRAHAVSADADASPAGDAT